MKTIWKLLVCFMLGIVVCGCEICSDDQEEGEEKYQRWENGEIRYYLDSSCSDYEKGQFRLRAQEWNDITNIKFIESDISGDYICSVYKDPSADGCYVSGYGKQKYCYIVYKNFNERCAILHEQGHLILGPHTHSEPRRDFYVKIYWENIIDGNEHNFKKLTAVDFPYDHTLFEYDYHSILHYQGWEYTKNGNKTIKSITDTEIFSMGISRTDIEKVNSIYM